MKWEDEAVVLAARPHGETSAVVQLLTRSHGRHAGLVRGGQGARLRGVYQAGNLVSAAWSGRLAEHLAATSEINRASRLPVVADVDDGFGDVVNVEMLVHPPDGGLHTSVVGLASAHQQPTEPIGGGACVGSLASAARAVLPGGTSLVPVRVILELEEPAVIERRRHG